MLGKSRVEDPRSVLYRPLSLPKKNSTNAHLKRSAAHKNYNKKKLNNTNISTMTTDKCNVIMIMK